MWFCIIWYVNYPVLLKQHIMNLNYIRWHVDTNKNFFFSPLGAGEAGEAARFYWSITNEWQQNHIALMPSNIFLV